MTLTRISLVIGVNAGFDSLLAIYRSAVLVTLAAVT